MAAVTRELAGRSGSNRHEGAGAGNGGNGREEAGAGERRRLAHGSRRGREAVVAYRRTKEEDDKWHHGQNGILRFRSAKNNYYTRRGVLEIKSQFHDVLETKSTFPVCFTQNRFLRVCCIQISLKIIILHILLHCFICNIKYVS